MYISICLNLHISSSFGAALQTLDADKVYVLGGLVDESIQKVLEYNFIFWVLKLWDTIPRRGAGS